MGSKTERRTSTALCSLALHVAAQRPSLARWFQRQCSARVLVRPKADTEGTAEPSLGELSTFPTFWVSRLPWCFQSWAAEGRVGARAVGAESILLEGCSHKRALKRANPLAAHATDSAGF